jgi:putative ABC transport system permease protein
MTTVVGIMPPDDYYPEILLPLTIDPASFSYQQRTLTVAARLKPGMTLQMARTEMTAIGAQLERELPESHQGWGITTRPYRVEFIAPGEEIVLGLLGLAAVAVLMIGCANIASLLLARGSARSQEMLIRSALGASRGRLIRQAFVEGSVLASGGAVLGTAFAFVGLRLLVRFAFPDGVPAYAAGRGFVNGGLLLFTVGATMGSAVFFALIPAWHHGQAEAGTLGGGVRNTSARSSQRVRSVLVAGEVAGTVVLLAIATLFLRTAVNLRSVEPGFDTRNLLLMKVALPDADDGTAQNAAGFYDRVVERFKASPQVVSAGAAQRVPVEGDRLNPNRSMVIEGRPTSKGEARVVDDVAVTAGYLETLRVRLREGRLLTNTDGADAPLVAVISDTTARRYWRQTSPIGAHVRLGDEPSAIEWRTVVGVVSDVRNDDIDTPPPPNVYVPAAQRPAREMTFMIRVSDDPLTHVAAARAAVAAEDPNLPVYEIRSMDQLLVEDLQGTYVLSSMTIVFAALALLLATVGIYGMVAYNIAQRTREIAVRIAVGAQMHHIMRHVLGQGVGAVVAGMTIGLVMALAVSRVLRIVLYGVSPTDPSTYALVALVLGGAATLACAVPAQRIFGVDPVVALRHE